MESVDAKMIRAREHIEALNREVADYLSSISVRLHLKFDPDVQTPWIVFHGTDYIAPMRLAAVVGDAVHNMRAALDNLVCGLAKTMDRSCDCKKTAFPYRNEESGWDGIAKSDLDRVPDAAKDIIKSLQPWLNPSSPLLQLNNLSNIDKHRHCHVALAYSRDTIFWIHCNDGTILEVSAQRPLFLGQVQKFYLPIDSALIRPNARIQTSAALILTFQDKGLWPDDAPVTQVLQDCFDYIERMVIAPLKPFFETPNSETVVTTTGN